MVTTTIDQTVRLADKLSELISMHNTNLRSGQRFGDCFIGGDNLAVTQPEANLFGINAQQFCHHWQVLVRFLQQNMYSIV